jgi:hypothetical protein
VTARPNAELAWRVIDHIDAHPDQHDQGHWVRQTDCGTTACFAGWTTILSGDRPVTELPGYVDGFTDVVTVDPEGRSYDLTVQARARELLGITHQAAHDLFYNAMSLDDLRDAVAEIFGPRPEQVLFIRQDGTSVDVTPEPDEDDVPPNAGSAS